MYESVESSFSEYTRDHSCGHVRVHLQILSVDYITNFSFTGDIASLTTTEVCLAGMMSRGEAAFLRTICVVVTA